MARILYWDDASQQWMMEDNGQPRHLTPEEREDYQEHMDDGGDGAVLIFDSNDESKAYFESIKAKAAQAKANALAEAKAKALEAIRRIKELGFSTSKELSDEKEKKRLQLVVIEAYRRINELSDEKEEERLQ